MYPDQDVGKRSKSTNSDNTIDRKVVYFFPVYQNDLYFLIDWEVNTISLNS